MQNPVAMFNQRTKIPYRVWVARCTFVRTKWNFDNQKVTCQLFKVGIISSQLRY